MTSDFKSTIIGYYVQSKTPEWIAKKLKVDPDKVEAVISKFNSSFLLQERIVRDDNISKEFIEVAEATLKNSGLIDDDITTIINRTIKNAQDNNKTYSTAKEFCKDCFRNMKTDAFFIKTGVSGTKGVTIMNSSVSGRIDEKRNRVMKNNQEHIFRPKG